MFNLVIVFAPLSQLEGNVPVSKKDDRKNSVSNKIICFCRDLLEAAFDRLQKVEMPIESDSHKMLICLFTGGNLD